MYTQHERTNRTGIDTEGYVLPIEEIVKRAKQAHAFGASEVCVQAGLPPHMDPELYFKYGTWNLPFFLFLPPSLLFSLFLHPVFLSCGSLCVGR